MKLKPTAVTIESEFKTFSLNAGVSQGGKMGIDFEIVYEETENKEEDSNRVQRLVLAEKEKLDILCLVSERSRGSITQEEYENRIAILKQGYAAVLRK